MEKNMGRHFFVSRTKFISFSKRLVPVARNIRIYCDKCSNKIFDLKGLIAELSTKLSALESPLKTTIASNFSPAIANVRNEEVIVEPSERLFRAHIIIRGELESADSDLDKTQVTRIFYPLTLSDWGFCPK